MAEQKTKHFWQDGIDLTDFEKILLGLIFFISFGVAVYEELFKGGCSVVWQGLVLGIGGLFVVRKALSYFKPTTYNQQDNDQF